MSNKPTPTIRDLYPALSEEELAEAESNIEKYLTVVLRIFERIHSETDNPVRQLTPSDTAVRYTEDNPESFS